MDFKDQILKNLSSNGFPDKKVSFGLETLYEVADNKGANLNNILDEIEKEGIKHTKEGDKIIFYQQENSSAKTEKDLFNQAKEAMDKMSPEELKKIQKMAQNMSDEEKAQMMEQAKKMGLI